MIDENDDDDNYDDDHYENYQENPDDSKLKSSFSA